MWNVLIAIIARLLPATGKDDSNILYVLWISATNVSQSSHLHMLYIFSKRSCTCQHHHRSDDDDPTVYPNAPELCDGIIDHDCDGSVGPDEYDDDGDGYMRCEGDCDDTDPTVYPGAPELCDGKDTDCDGNYPPEEADNDLDGFMVCEGDCDDFGPFVYPGAPELCDGIDNNCDGVLGPGEVDADGDGYMVCEGDCDDSNPLIHPFGGESCNGIDDNCDGVLGPGEVDADGDGYMVCEGDCDDADPTVYPGAPELCDGKDNDCDGTVDEGCPPPTVPPTPSPSACSDSSLRLKIPKDGTIITRSCEWVARTDTSARCNLIGVSAACPVTCGSCDTCADPELRFKFTYNNMYIARSCEYVGRIENKISGRCAASHNICRQTCGMC